jgi:mannosyltransferase OCH1-like enzyme
MSSEQQHQNSHIDITYAYPQLPVYVAPRVADIPIANNYHTNMQLCDQRSKKPSNCGDFHVVIYYLDRFSGWLSLRRLDDSGWNITVQVKLFDLDDTSKVDVISVGPSPKVSYGKQFFNSKITLHPDSTIYRNQSIPKRIIQTYYSREAFSSYHWNAYHTFLDLNPEYEVIMLNNQESRAFMKANFAADVLAAYDSLVPAAFQADLFRYCYLYVYGGCYFDNKMIARQALRELIQEFDDFLVSSDTLPGGYMAESLHDTTRIYNAVICSQAHDKRLYDTILYVLSNIESRGQDIRYHVTSDLALTGPLAFYRAIASEIAEENLRMKHGYLPSASSPADYHRDYTDYYIINKLNGQVAFHKAFKYYYRYRHGGYSKLWREGRVFYDRPILLNDQYQVYLESSFTRLYHYHIVNQSQILISRSAWSFTWKNFFDDLNAGLVSFARIEKVQSIRSPNVIATTNNGKLFRYVSDDGDGEACSRMARWFTTSYSESSHPSRRFLKDGAPVSLANTDIHVGRTTYIKIIHEETNEEVMLSFDLALSMNVVTRIDICL